MVRTRTFNGKVYRFWYTTHNKGIAEELAEQLRSGGDPMMILGMKGRRPGVVARTKGERYSVRITPSPRPPGLTMRIAFGYRQRWDMWIRKR